MAKMRGNAVVGQSGGPTCVINQSLVGVIEEAQRHDEIHTVFGARHGVRGVIEENFVDLTHSTPEILQAVADTPSAALGSSRDKPDAEYCEKIFKVFRKYDVKYFFYIGGNDSADTARIVNNLADEAHYELRVFHIPKTIDNDLLVTDHCPGYGTAARFVACALMGDNLDNRALPGVKIDIIMGRHAGFLTAASVLGRHHEDDGPHLVYCPEVPFDANRFLDAVLREYERWGRCVVAICEGIADAEGTPIAGKIRTVSETDAHGNVQLSGSGSLGDYLSGLVRHQLAERFRKNVRVRADTLGYLQRCFPGFMSDVDQHEARMVGRMAVRYAAAEDIDGSVALRRTGNGRNYDSETFVTSLASVARDTKSLPREYLNPDGDNVNPSFKEYAGPLIGELPRLGRFE